MLLLRRHLLPFLRAAVPLPSPLHHRACPLATSPAPFSLEEFLVDACGLAPAQARKTARKAFDESSKLTKKAFEDLSRSRLKSASNPRAVLALLSGVGLSRADIAAVVAADPLLLRASAKNIEARLLDLRDRLGLSAPQIVCFLLVGSRHLRICDVVPRIKFFISFYGSFEKFVVVLKRCSCILQSNLERVVKPKIAFLRQCSLSVRDIAQLCSVRPRVLIYSLEHVKELVLRAEELGVPRSSQRFWRAVSVVAIGKECVAAKLIYLKSTFGCYKSEVATAMSKMPSILGIPEESLHRKITFLIDELPLCTLVFSKFNASPPTPLLATVAVVVRRMGEMPLAAADALAAFWSRDYRRQHSCAGRGQLLVMLGRCLLQAVPASPCAQGHRSSCFSIDMYRAAPLPLQEVLWRASLSNGTLVGYANSLLDY